MNALNAISTIVVLIIIAGLWKRKDRALHYKLMVLAFIIDMGMVVYIEFMRGAVETAVSSPPPLMLFHIFVSVMSIVFYLVQFYLGWRLFKGKVTSTKTHMYCGILFCVFRLSNYVTSFMVGSSD